MRSLLAAVLASMTVLLASATPAEAATKRVTLDQLVYGRLGLDGGTGQRFETYWLGHGGPAKWDGRRHPMDSVDPATCTWVYGTLCALATAALDAAAVADPGR